MQHSCTWVTQQKILLQSRIGGHNITLDAKSGSHAVCLGKNKVLYI
jgi:ribosomal protein L31